MAPPPQTSPKSTATTPKPTPALPPYPPDQADPSLAARIAALAAIPFHRRPNHNCAHCGGHARFSVERRQYDDGPFELTATKRYVRIYLRCRACKELSDCEDFGLANPEWQVKLGKVIEETAKNASTPSQTGLVTRKHNSPTSANKTEQTPPKKRARFEDDSVSMDQFCAREAFWQGEIRSLKEDHIENMNRLRDRQRDKLRGVKEQQAEKLRLLEAEHNEDMGQMRDRYRRRIDGLKKKVLGLEEGHAEAMDALRDRYRRKVDELRVKLRLVEEEHNEDMDALRVRYRRKIDNLKERLRGY